MRISGAGNEKAPDDAGAFIPTGFPSISSEALRDFECGCELSANPLNHRNYRNGNAGCNQPIFDGGGRGFVLCKPDHDVSHFWILSAIYGCQDQLVDRNKAPLRAP
jgi:hypothetical protein